MADETWRWIPGFEFRYAVSTLGRIKRVDRSGNERIRTPTRHRDGYAKIKISDVFHREHTWHVHRAVGLAFLGPRPDGAFIDHINGDHADNRVENLRYLPPKESSKNRKPRFSGRQYTGVPYVYHHARGGYFARIKNNYVSKRLGCYDTIEKAKAAVEAFLAKTAAARSAKGNEGDCGRDGIRRCGSTSPGCNAMDDLSHPDAAATVTQSSMGDERESDCRAGELVATGSERFAGFPHAVSHIRE